MKKPSPYFTICWSFVLRLFEDLRQVVSGIRAGRRDERVDVPPFLRPHVAEEMRGDRPARRDAVAVLLAQLRAHVGVERDVERLHLLPEAVQLRREGVRRHVVLRAPHRAGVGEAQLPGALVRERDVRDEVLSHGTRDGMPSRPGVEELVVVATRSRGPSRARRGRGTPLSRPPPSGSTFPCRTVPSIDETMRVSCSLSFGSAGVASVRPFFRSLILRASVSRQRDLVEPHGLLRQLDGRVDRALVGLRREELGVLGDEVELHPVGAPRLHGELQQALLGGRQERLRLGRRSAARLAAAERARQSTVREERTAVEHLMRDR